MLTYKDGFKSMILTGRGTRHTYKIRGWRASRRK